MGTYLLSIEKAFLSFPFVAAILTIPFLIFNYRRYGYINKFRVFITYSFVLYCMIALYLVILPFPSTRDTCSLQLPYTGYYNFVPFIFIYDFLKETNVLWNVPSTYLHMLTERAFLQTVFNFLLLLPLGIYVRYYFNRKKVWAAAIAGFFVSLFFELTQVTGIYGYYNCPYRLFDVDDLILNTSGTMIGFLIAPIFLYLFPSKETLDTGVDLEEKPVSLIHRFLAFFFDMIIVNAVIIWIHLTFGLQTSGFSYLLVTFSSVYFLYFIVFVFLTNGKTIGMYIVKLKVYGRSGSLRFKEIFIRNGSLYFGYGFLTYFPLYTVTGLGMDPMAQFLGVVFIFMIQILFYSHFIWRVIQRKRIFYYELLSGTRIQRQRRR
ncbi:VanZ family protein [Bacillus sp. CLL-7-23]|uniref:VanZ family protein n=1 Tax=Bacillus changyiensis TaxID=3004103 RepID=A0ABT4X7F4_9BACI|nr:VanZ family protein [Bacillus changyiensis]MDA7028215.1 VanZ family protein [Bacillus changyiensis]